MNRARNGWTAFARSLPTHRFHDWSKTEAALQRPRHCSVICQSIFKTKISLERSFPALNEHVLRLGIERETAEQRRLEVCRRIDFAIDRRLRAASVRGTAASFVDRFSNPRYHWKDLCLLWTTHVLLLWIKQERLNSVRLKFVDASISQLIEDRGRSEVQPSYRLSKVRETSAAFGTLTWRKHKAKCRSWKHFFFYFQQCKGKENFKLCMCWLKTHTQYFYIIVTYDTPNHDNTRFSKGAVNLKVLKPLPHSSQMPKDQHIGHRNLFKNTS